jgi:hypothetical protein
MRALAVFLLCALSGAEAYVRMKTTTGEGLHRTDFASVSFQLNDATGPGMTNADGFPVITAESDPTAALRSALDTWNAVSSSAARFAPLDFTPRMNDPADGANVILFRDTPEIRGLVGSALAVTFVQFYLDGRIIESDIVFNPNVISRGEPRSFSTNLAPGTYDIQAIATHELGHALGANHSLLLSASMFQSTLSGVNAQSSLTADDVAFVREVYPSADADGAFGRISGAVSFTGGGPVRAAAISAIDPKSGVAISALSNADGVYRIDGIPPGDYLVYAEPLNGPVFPRNVSLVDDDVDAAFQTSFFGSNAAPERLAVVAGGTATADIAVASETSPLEIRYVSFGSAGGSDFGRFGLYPVTLKAGESLDLLLAGPGLDNLSAENVALLGPGLTVVQNSFHVTDLTVNDQPVVRFTVEAAPRSEPAVATLIVAKGPALTALSGVLRITPQ